MSLSRHTGEPINTREHIAQSVTDILTTRHGTRVLARGYGSDLPDLIDRPMNAALKMDIFAATVGALRKHEPRIRVRRVRLDNSSAGQARISIDAADLDGRPITISDIAIRPEAVG